MSLPARFKILNPFHIVLRRMGKTWIALRYLKAYGHRMKKKNPETFHEKVFWLMNNTDTSKWSELADKYKVREFVTRRVGVHILPKLYGVWKRPEDIKFKKLPIPCVIKTNNGCTTNIFIRSKEDFDRPAIISQLKQYLSIHYGDLTAERHYTPIPPRIICEELMVDDANPGKALVDYKFHCFDGEPVYCQVMSDRVLNTHSHKGMIYDMNFTPQPQLIDFTVDSIEPLTTLEKPVCWEHMKAVARALSFGLEYVRVDLYCVNGHTMFGEMSFTPGLEHYYNDLFASELGKRIRLPEQ